MATSAPAVVIPLKLTGWLRNRAAAARFAWVVVAYMILVALWGALVRATGSGAGCGNNWPLCNGQVVPLSPTTHTVIEFIHRQMVTGSVLATILLLVWTWRSTTKGMAARWFAGLSFLFLANEAFLGALLVKLGYVTGNQSVGRVILLSIHLTNTLLLLAVLTLTARMLTTAQTWPAIRRHSDGTDGAVAITGLLATLLVGVSGSLAALGDTLFPASSLRAAFAQDIAPGSSWILRLRGIHPVSAAVAAAFIVWLVLRARRIGSRRWTSVVLGLLTLQFILGLADVLLLAPAWMQIVHLAGADLYWTALVTGTAEVLWPVHSPLIQTTVNA